MLTLALASLVAGAQGRFSVSKDRYVTGDDVADVLVLSNAKTGERASILLSGGGGVDELHLAPQSGGNRSLREVLWSYDRNATAVALNPTWQGRMLLPYANRIGGAKYDFNGSSHSLPINDVAGLNNSIHGLLWNQTMHLESQRADEKQASVSLGYRFNSERVESEGYPFALAVSIEYVLSPGRFDVTVTARNEDPQGWPLPFFNGWHPYFLCHPCSEAFVVLDQDVPWRHVDVVKDKKFPPPRYSNMIPTTQTSEWRDTNGTAPLGPGADMPHTPRYLDDEVKAMKALDRDFATKLVDPATSQAVVVHHDAAMHYLQIFTGALENFAGSDSVVLEPLSAMSDAYNNHDGLHTISAGESFVSRFGVEVESADLPLVL